MGDSGGEEGLGLGLRSRERERDRFPSDLIDLRRDGVLGSGDSCTVVEAAAFLRVGVANTEEESALAEGVAVWNGIGCLIVKLSKSSMRSSA